MLILILLYFAEPYFETHHQKFEEFASVLVNQPVRVSKIVVRNNGLEPVLKLYDVAIFNETKTKVLLQAQELQIGIDLIGSLFKWNIKPGLLMVRGANFFIYQNKNGELFASGLKGTLNDSAVDTNSAFIEILRWLFEQSKIDLSNIALTWSLADGELLKFSDLQVKLYNGVLQHELKVSGSFAQKQPPAKFEADLKLRGDILKQTVFSLAGNVTIEDCLFKLPEQFSGGGFVVPSAGNINLLLKHPQVKAKFFRAPLAVESIEGKIVWQNTKDNLDVRIDKFRYQDTWLALRGDLQFLLPQVSPDQNANSPAPVVDMRLEFRLANLAKAKLYYPVTELPPDAAVWLDKAFVSSKPMVGDMILKGPLDKFPFDHNEGRFLANANIRDVHLNYDSAWPPIEHLNGKLTFANRSMVILTQDAKIMRSPIGLIKAVIPDLDIPTLSIDSFINSDSSVGLQFVNSSPLKENIGSKLQAINLTGPMRLDLKMVMPLSSLLSPKDAKTKVDGLITLHANYLQPCDLDFGLNNIQGELRFTENDLMADKLSGELFGRPMELAVKTLKTKSNDTITQVAMTGSAAIVDIEKGFAVQLNPYVAGDFTYRGLLELHDSPQSNVFKLNSNLYGITIDLPEPFAKSATSKSKINLAYYFGGNKLPRITVNYNDQVNAALAIKKIKVKPWTVLTGEIKFGGAPAAIVETSGIVISGFIKNLDWSVWRSYLSKMENNFTGVGTTIRQIGLKVDELRALGQVLKKVSLQAKPKNNGWEIMLVMPDIQGKIFFPLASGAQIQGVFHRLYLNSGKEQQKTAVLKPQDLAPLHFIINDFRYDNRKFNRIEFVTQPQLQPKRLEIVKINITDPKFGLTASGNWIATGEKQQTTLSGKISSVDIGGLLQQLELTGDVIGGKGEANFALKWPNVPYKPTLKEIEGTFVVNASKGQIINFSGKTEAKLGFSRVLNLFSLRHLSLDLGDLTKRGIGFDKLEGALEIARGNALVRKIKFDGPMVGVKAKGRIGLVAQDYDINLSVTPHITSSVPAVVTILSASNPLGPLLGLASWVVTDKIIAPAIKKVTTYRYHITGGWSDPTINKI